MTPPPRTAQRTPPGASPSGTARWLNLVTTTVLGAALIVLAVAATPSLLRAGLTAGDEPQDFPPPVRGRHPTVVPRDHQHAIPVDDEPPPSVDDEPDRRDARPLSPNDPRQAPPRLPGHPDEDDDDSGLLGLKGGVTLKPLVLRERRTGTVLHEVKAGQAVSILRDDGEWLLVVHKTRDGMMTGWAKRGELLLR